VIFEKGDPRDQKRETRASEVKGGWKGARRRLMAYKLVLRELSKEHLQEPRVLAILEHFLVFEQTHPGCVVLDSVAAQRRLMSRTEMTAIFTEIPKLEPVSILFLLFPPPHPTFLLPSSSPLFPLLPLISTSSPPLLYLLC
jgi:hypothetical protein